MRTLRLPLKRRALSLQRAALSPRQPSRRPPRWSALVRAGLDAVEALQGRRELEAERKARAAAEARRRCEAALASR